MPNSSITINSSWYCAYTASNEWVSSYYYGHYIYCGYANWHTGEGKFNWRACVEFTTDDDIESVYKINSFTFATKITQDGYPYHAKAYLSKVPPKLKNQAGLYPCGDNGVVPKGNGNYSRDKFKDTTITEYFSTRYLASAWATTDAAGNTRPSKKVADGEMLYFTFKGDSLSLEKNTKYYIYFVRQDDCSDHSSHGQSGFVSALPSSSKTTIDYTPEVSFSLKETLNGGSAEEFSGTYGTLEHSFDPEAKSGSLPNYKVLVGTEYTLSGVTANNGYECTGGGTTTKTINSDSSHTIDFYRKDAIQYHNHLLQEKDIDYIRYGSTLTTRSYTYTMPPCKTFQKWERYTSDDGVGDATFDAKKSYGHSSLVPPTQEVGVAVKFRPIFSNNQCTVSYVPAPKYPFAYVASEYSQKVTYTESFVVGDIKGLTFDTARYVHRGWYIHGWGQDYREYSHLESAIYDWTDEQVLAYPLVDLRTYTIILYNGDTFESLSCVYGDDIFSETFRRTKEESLGVQSHRSIVGWRLRGSDSIISSWEDIVANSVNDEIQLEAVVDDNIKLIVYNVEGGTVTKQRVYIKQYNEITNEWEDLAPYIT
jgi:hypothetical protein